MRCGDDFRYDSGSYGHGRSERLHRSSGGLIFGVCEGLSEWSGIPVGIVRTIALVALLSTGFFPVGLAYILAALFLPVM